MSKFPKMNPKVRRAWVKALRSGKYKQGEEQLRNENEDGDRMHCCLGVLCEVQGVRYENFAPTVPRPFAKKIGLFHPEDYFGGEWGKGVQGRLAKMNDGDGTPKRGFRAIATWIEKNL